MTCILAGNKEHLESLAKDYTADGWKLEQTTSRNLAILTKGEKDIIIIETKW